MCAKCENTGPREGRSFNCALPSCNALAAICTSCDRGHKYCRKEHAEEGRERNGRAARAAYSRTEKGRAASRRSSKALRDRRREEAEQAAKDKATAQAAMLPANKNAGPEAISESSAPAEAAKDPGTETVIADVVVANTGIAEEAAQFETPPAKMNAGPEKIPESSAPAEAAKGPGPETVIAEVAVAKTGIAEEAVQFETPPAKMNVRPEEIQENSAPSEAAKDRDAETVIAEVAVAEPAVAQTGVVEMDVAENDATEINFQKCDISLLPTTEDDALVGSPTGDSAGEASTESTKVQIPSALRCCRCSGVIDIFLQ